MKRDPDFFGETELTLVYMARRLRDALRLEQLLTAGEIDFLVETGTYTGGLLMRRELTGAFFYVQPESVNQATRILLENRFQPYQPG